MLVARRSPSACPMISMRSGWLGVKVATVAIISRARVDHLGDIPTSSEQCHLDCRLGFLVDLGNRLDSIAFQVIEVDGAANITAQAQEACRSRFDF